MSDDQDHLSPSSKEHEEQSSPRGETTPASERVTTRFKYELLFENCTDAIVIADRDGHLIDCNRRMLELFGHSFERMRGAHFSEFLPPGHVDVRQRDWERWKQGESFTEEVTFVVAGGREIIVENSSAVVDLGDRQVIQSVLRDRTEQRRAQRELEATRRQLWRAQKMESLGRLAGSIAHDFNNMLSVMLTCSSFLLEELDPEDPRREDALDIREAAEQSAMLTRQLLAFSRQQVLDPSVEQLDAVVARTGRLCRRVIEAPIDLDVQLEAGDMTVYVDSGKLEQVIVNLVLNARDAIDCRGRIELRTRPDTVGTDAAGTLAPGRYGVISVRDDGCGVDSEALDQIFEPFYTTKSEREGMGLGLATAHGIVRQSGGHILVDSTPGKGSEFSIWLPQVSDGPPIEEESHAEVSSRESGAQATILLVDDNRVVRRSLTRGLERKGYRLLVAADGREALEVWQEHAEQIDVVISDILMPEIDGVELLERLHEAAPELPVFLLTGCTEDRDLGPASRKAVEIMHKPISPSQICERLSKVL